MQIAWKTFFATDLFPTLVQTVTYLCHPDPDLEQENRQNNREMYAKLLLPTFKRSFSGKLLQGSVASRVMKMGRAVHGCHSSNISPRNSWSNFGSFPLSWSFRLAETHGRIQGSEGSFGISRPCMQTYPSTAKKDYYKWIAFLNSWTGQWFLFCTWWRTVHGGWLPYNHCSLK